MVPAAANYPFSWGRSLDACGDALLHVVERFAAHEIDVQFFKAAGTKMHVSVIKAGHHKVSAEIDHKRVFAAMSRGFLAKPQPTDLAPGNSYGAESYLWGRFFGSNVLRPHLSRWNNAGINVPVNEDYVSSGVIFCRRQT